MGLLQPGDPVQTALGRPEVPMDGTFCLQVPASGSMSLCSVTGFRFPHLILDFRAQRSSCEWFRKVLN